MFLYARRTFALFRIPLFTLALILPALSLSSITIYAQGGTDHTGTGGRHTIQGRIVFPSGRRVDGASIKVTLENMNAGNLAVFVDSYGSFSFRNLIGGSYTIVIGATEYYEAVRESVTVDDGGGRYVRSVPGVVNVQIFLQPKRGSDKASGVINSALTNLPKEAVEFYTKGLEAAKADEAEKAIAFLESALRIHAEFPLALNELGLQYLKLKQTDKAIEVLREALKYSPEAFAPRLNLGIALWGRNDINESEKQLREALKRNQESWVAHMYLGLTQIKLQNFDEAEKELLHALTFGGDNLSLPHYYLGGIYWRRKDYTKAADELEKYLKLEPKAHDAEQTRNSIKKLRSMRN